MQTTEQMSLSMRFQNNNRNDSVTIKVNLTTIIFTQVIKLEKPAFLHA